MASLLEIRERIDECTSHIYFSFQGIDGVIDPISRKEIYLQFGNEHTVIAHSVEEALTTAFINGKTIAEVADKLVID